MHFEFGVYRWCWRAPTLAGTNHAQLYAYFKIKCHARQSHKFIIKADECDREGGGKERELV